MEAIRSGAPAALALTRADLAERVASRERERLNRLASQWGISDRLLPHLALCVTLQGGCDPADALQLVLEEQRAMGFPEAVPGTELVNRLTEALPLTGGDGVDAVRPDLIGEAFLLQGMREHRLLHHVQTGIVERAWRRAGSKAAAALVRTSQDFAQGDAKHPSIIWLQHLLDRATDLAALISVNDVLPINTVALREVALLAQRRIVSTIADQAEATWELRAHLAEASDHLSSRLSALGQREPALEAAREAVAIYRELTAQQPDGLCHGNSIRHASKSRRAMGSRRCDGISPLRSSFGAEDPQGGSGDEVALKVEGVVDRAVHAEETLGGWS
jgi:hypothetical protein